MRRGVWFCVKIAVAMAMPLALGACGGGRGAGSFDAQESTTSKFTSLFGFNRSPPPPNTTSGPDMKISCPEIVVLEGTAAQRVYSGAAQDNDTLRYQYSLGDVGRECARQGDQFSLKVGVAGRVLLGPVGAPGNFNVPIRIAVVRERDQQPVVSKLYHVAATVAPGQTLADFSVVSEPFLVPFTKEHEEDDYTIKVGIDTGPGTAKKPTHVRRRKR